MEFLGEEEEEVQGPLATAVKISGQGSTSGATWGKLVVAREMLLGRVMARALELHPEQEHRAVWSWPERDKLSAQWLLCLPGHDSTLAADEMADSVAAVLCLPSPACSDPLKLGMKVGRRTVDRFGDNVMAEAVA
jgi:hypothetical protein